MNFRCLIKKNWLLSSFSSSLSNCFLLQRYLEDCEISQRLFCILFLSYLGTLQAYRTDSDIIFGSEPALVLVWPSSVSLLVFNNFVDTCEPTNQPKSQTVTHPVHFFFFIYLVSKNVLSHAHIAVVFELYFKSMLHIVSWDLCFLFSVTYKICLYFFFWCHYLFIFITLYYFVMWKYHR